MFYRYDIVQSIFRYLEPFRRDSQVCQTDGRTDILVANAMLNYFVWPEVTELISQSLMHILYNVMLMICLVSQVAVRGRLV